jgi:hypothetical protein
MKHNICILLLMHVGMTHIFTLIKSYYINIDRGGVMYKHICSIRYLNNFFVIGDVDNLYAYLRGYLIF